MVNRKVRKLSPKIQLSQERLSKFLGKQYVLLTIFWIVFTAMLIYVLILFIQERGMVNNTPEISKLLNQLKTPPPLADDVKQKIYKELVELTVYPIIDFSLMKFDFFGTKTDVIDWEAAWNDRIKNINLAYSYVFISAMIALIALFFYILINIKTLRRRIFEKKYQLSTVYPNNYFIFNTKIYLDFITSLTIVFCFFNFITTIIAIIYGIFNVVISTLNRWIFKVDSPAFLPRKWKEIIMKNIFKPPATKEPFSSDLKTVNKKFNFLRNQVFIVSILGYMMYYFTRKSVDITGSHLMETGGLNTYNYALMGMFFSITYGCSKFIIGGFADRSSGRIVMTMGLLVSAILNIALGGVIQIGNGQITVTPLVVMIIILTALGIFQGMGWPATARMMAHWFTDKERSPRLAIWNSGQGLGAAFAPLIIIGRIKFC